MAKDVFARLKSEIDFRDKALKEAQEAEERRKEELLKKLAFDGISISEIFAQPRMPEVRSEPR